MTLGFFDDILIPPEGLQHPSRFDEREQIWIWEYATEGEEAHEMYMDKGENIRFRIVGECFTDTTPVPTVVATPGPGPNPPAPAPAVPEEADVPKSPYTITVRRFLQLHQNRA